MICKSSVNIHMRETKQKINRSVKLKYFDFNSVLLKKCGSSCIKTYISKYMDFGLSTRVCMYVYMCACVYMCV